MKTFFSHLCLLISILIPQLVHPATIDSLQGSYTCLPQELRALSLLDGAVALNTGMLRRIHSAKSTPGISNNVHTIVQGLFNLIPGTDHFELSKILDQQTLVANLINNLVYGFLRDQLTNSSTQQLTNFAQHFTQINPMSAPLFARASFEVSRLAILGALWYYKQHVQDFDYDQELKTTLIKACNKELKAKKLPNDMLVKLETIRKTAESIGQPQQAVGTWADDKYENFALRKVELLQGSDELPPILEQVFHAIITLNNVKHNFADCAETLIRNLIIKFYTQYQSFDLQTPAKKSTDQQKAAITQYNSHSYKAKQAYNDWAQLVSNISNINYGAQDHDMEPTWANLIVIIDHLLGTNWLKPTDNDSQPISPTQQPVKFAKKHLRKLIKLLGTSSFDPSTLPNEYGTLKIQKGTSSIIIKLRSDHGYVTFNKEEGNAKPHSPLTNADLIKYPMLWLLMPTKIWPQNSSLPQLAYLFAQPIDQANTIRELPEQLPGITYPALQLIKKQIDTLLSNQDHGKTLTSVALYTHFIKTNDLTAVKPELADAIVNQVITATETFLTHSNWNIRYALLKLFQILVEKGKAYVQATNVAASALPDSDSNLRSAALQLFQALVEKGQAYNHAANAASNALNDPDDTVRKTTLKLFNTLFEKGQAYAQAINTAAITLTESPWYVRPTALELFKALFEKGQAYNEAARAAKTALTYSDSNVRKTALELKGLVEQTQQHIL